MFTENEWNELLEKNQQLEKEKKKLQQTVLDFQSRYNESLAEIKRYREALETIANGDLAPSLIKEMYIDQAYQTIAEKALKENK